MRLLIGIVFLFATHSPTAQVLIRNTNVLDVENKKILKGYSVLVNDGRIISVDKDRQYKLAPGTRVIDGEGKFLAPGLVDAHVHFFQSGGLFTRPDAIDLRKYRTHTEELKWSHDNMDDLLRRYLSAGITSVIDVGSTYNFLTQRDTFADKKYVPDIFMAGPLLTTWIPDAFKDLGNDGPFILMQTEENTRQGVRDQLRYKPDLIKIWYIVTDKDKEKGARKNLELVRAAIDEAHKNNLRVAVHATELITAKLAVEAGAEFLVHNIEDEIITDEFLQLLKKKNVVVCPTLIVGNGYFHTFAHNYSFTTDELELSNPAPVSDILNFPWPDTALGNKYISLLNSLARQDRNRHEDSVMTVNVKKMLDAGITVAAGTDAGNIGTQHVGAYLRELQAMHKAGFSMWDILTSATINGAKAMNLQSGFGSITKGKQADMLLLSANPLDSLANFRKIEWVINKGVVFHPDSLVSTTPEQLVQQQLNAYNAHNLEAFLEPYSEDVEIYTFPSKLEMKGKAAMRNAYQFINTTPGLYCKLLSRIVQNNMIIDHEEIWKDGKKQVHAIAMYTIEHGKISKVYFSK
ncbi:MAG: amidohydrolase family protein [Chitinophagaceae bacterium]|nr:amidohydrolase family protein [Chitinophagaceae bacterium]